jgi:hypothetical protein
MDYSYYKICFVYEYGSESWSTPQSLINEFIRRGHSVSRVHLSNTLNFHKALVSNVYDIIIIMDWKGIDIPQVIHNQIPKSTFKIRECGDTPQNYEAHLSHIKNYNVLLTPDYVSCQKYIAAGVPCLWFNHFADTDIHKIYDGEDGMPPVRSTRGQGGSVIMDALSTLMPDKFLNKNGLMGSEYGRFLGQGKIVIQNSRWGEITRRIFEGMACKKLVITDRLPEHTRITDLFEEGKEIVFYDDFPDLISKINYYLCPEGERGREDIATNSYNKVISSHTQYIRVNEILDSYISWKNSL